MAQLKIQTRKKLLPLSIAVALGTFASNIHASSVTINTSGSYTVGAGATPVTTSAALDSAVDTATSVQSSGYGSTVDYTSNANYFTRGYTNGGFFARASGTSYGEAYNATSSITYVDTIFNNSGTAQNYTFDFNIIQGALSVYGTPTAAGDFAYADYSVNIFLTDSSGVSTSIFSSAAQLNMDDTGTINFTGDTTLGGAYGGGNIYGWTNYTGSLDLGTFNAGDNFTLTYGMTANARGQITSAPSGGTPTVGYGECGIECGEGGGVSGGSNSRTGDPFGVSGTGTTISSTPVSVPEASSVFLMGLGLAGLAATRRRKSKLNG